MESLWLFGLSVQRMTAQNIKGGTCCLLIGQNIILNNTTSINQSGKVCQRKVSAKISKTLINIIKCNIDQVVDYEELYKQATKGA